ncbi:MAG: hypothetical protein ACI9KE_000493 [Polyangiales bacterium]|jgi:hypothetical protein
MLPLGASASYTAGVRGFLVVALWLGLACSGSEETQEEPQAPLEPENARNGQAPDPEDDPLAGLDDPDLITDIPDGVAQQAPVEVPRNGCATFGEQALRVWAHPGIADIVAVGDDGFAIAGYANGASGEEVFALTITPGGAPRPILRELLERPLQTPRVAPPGLGAIDSGHIGIAISDLGARVLFDVVQLGGRRLGFREVGNDADQRFSPAVASTGSTRLVAYTEGSELTRVWAVVVDGAGRVTGRHDITPLSATARAPLWIEPHNMVFVDAREGTSTLWNQAFLPSGTPDGDPEVFAAVANTYDPIQWATAPAATGHVLSFVAVGRAAKTAVGTISTEDPTPRPVVPSEGYGSLSTDLVASDHSLVFVADAPLGEDRESRREVRVRRASNAAPAELGEAISLRGPDGSAHHARVARRGEDYAVVFGSSDGVYVHFLRCDES